MDTWEVRGWVKGRQTWAVSSRFCPYCQQEFHHCDGHLFDIPAIAVVEAESSSMAIDKAQDDIAERMSHYAESQNCWSIECSWDFYEGTDEPRVINLSELARDRSKLYAWNEGLPIPGGSPVVLWGSYE